MGSASRRRWAIRGGLAGAAAMAAVASVALAITPAHAADVNPFSPTAGHPARHGAVPTIETAQKMASYRANHPLAATPNPANLVYGGAVDGIGVTTGKPRVYVVFWGKQW